MDIDKLIGDTWRDMAWLDQPELVQFKYACHALLARLAQDTEPDYWLNWGSAVGGRVYITKGMRDGNGPNLQPLFLHPPLTQPVIDKSILKRLVTQVFGEGYGITHCNVQDAEPVAWQYSDNYGTHYTDDKREWYDSVGIESVQPLYKHPPLTQRSDDEQPRSVPEGWVLVPKEPTAEMVEAVCKIKIERLLRMGEGNKGVVAGCQEDYKAMIAAAPKEPEWGSREHVSELLKDDKLGLDGLGGSSIRKEITK